jgi:cobyrinic acid a,c-diamide synthase
MLPTERCDELKQGIVFQPACVAQRLSSTLEVNGIPQHDRRRHQIQAAGPVPLLLKRSVPDFAESVDRAFCFLYPANVEVLQALGAELQFFSPLADEPVPVGADAIYLPGGYPELHGAALARAVRWQQSIRAAHHAGVPILAECGGMMAVSESITDKDGHTWPMAGLLPGQVRMQGRLAGLGAQAMPTEMGELRSYLPLLPHRNGH